MKNLKAIGILVFSIVMVSCTAEQKVDAANKDFCHNLKSFSEDLNKLDVANEGTDINAFNRAYDKAGRSWDKLVDSAADLEAVQWNESVNSYNKMENKINAILNNDKTADDSDQINKEIDDTANKIADLLSTECK
jgi:hypothetical protein